MTWILIMCLAKNAPLWGSFDPTSCAHIGSLEVTIVNEQQCKSVKRTFDPNHDVNVWCVSPDGVFWGEEK